LYREKGRYLEVPRNYKVPYNEVGKAWLEEEGHPIRVGKPPVKVRDKITHNITLRDSIQADASFALQRGRRDKILSLSCGKGKTVVSLHAAIERRLFPILVIVHTEHLLTQWKEAIQKFYQYENGTPIRVGHVQGSVCEWKGYPIVVGMLHSLVLKEYPQEFYDYFRLVISDETHRLGAQLFMKACSLFPAERWGLSATMKRGDGMEKVIHLHLGDVVYEDLSQPLKPKTYFVDTGIALDESKYKNYRSGRLNLPKMINHLSEDERRNHGILSWIHKCVKSNRTVLVLGERVEQLNFLMEGCTAKSKSMHVGSMKPEARKDALTKQVVFATQHIAKEGLDRPAFDTLFILFPFGGEGRLRQSIGRILRTEDGKKDPLVFVFEDSVSIMGALCNKMRRHLKALKFECHNMPMDKWESENNRGVAKPTMGEVRSG
jgi:superfamily II DNA or RNA helicase